MKLYNSLTRTIDSFIPRNDKKVTMYVCGITPYDTTHLGHAFTYMTFDILVRLLEYKGFEVSYTQNVTDIDDDILRKAKETKRDWRELGNFWTEKFLNDIKTLNIRMPTNYVKATFYIDKIIELTEKLVSKGNAYEKDGNVYFDIKKNPQYGKLSHFTENQMLMIARERGGRVDDPNIKNPLDFILWQKSKENEPFWDSPWGKGRPGWHIECTAMIHKTLGEQIDIHGGGRDLIFPHHESEIAQSESATEKVPYVATWMHTAMLMYQGEKMAKSLGNLVMVSDLLKKYDSNVIRWTLLSHHYRKPWDFDESMIEGAQIQWNEVLLAIGKNQGEMDKTDEVEKIVDILGNDLDTPEALRFITNMAHNKSSQLQKVLEVLGFDPKIKV